MPKASAESHSPDLPYQCRFCEFDVSQMLPQHKTKDRASAIGGLDRAVDVLKGMEGWRDGGMEPDTVSFTPLTPGRLSVSVSP
ncbi:hypothetical protein EYF80_052630 [Liparis tanakae]|uniref:Uncharacterized protein n=1 Tax=Liparis tanakae TaxID=230148 RepID=A0A4Z2F7S5_9TELE|nr:hypothetical protein EYF80_052630 [Liparis tanakae]